MAVNYKQPKSLETLQVLVLLAALAFTCFTITKVQILTQSLEALQLLGANVHIKDGLGWTLMHQVCLVLVLVS